MGFKELSPTLQCQTNGLAIENLDFEEIQFLICVHFHPHAETCNHPRQF